ncbi:MAG: AsmA-like C-terminal region-containing protein [Lentisphaerae bacterium]|nr:AsmA-like C-terminal region-containing protein [Lentisphaerota bacterium]
MSSVLFYLLAPKVLRSWCRKHGIEYQYATCHFRLPGTLALSEFQLRKNGKFSFSAERLQWDGSLSSCLFGRWNAETFQVHNAALEISQTQHTGKVQLSEMTMQLRDVAMGSKASGFFEAAVGEIHLQKDGILTGGTLQVKTFFQVSKECLFDLLQGQIALSDTSLTRRGQTIRNISGTADYALRQNAADSWQIIPGAVEDAPLNHIQVRVSDREVINVLVKSGSWKKDSGQQEASLELTSTCIDSDPFLALLSPTVYIWASGRLKYLQLDLQSRGIDTESLLQNLEGSVALDIEQLHLKNSPFIEIFSRQTALDLPKYLRFERGSAILKIANQTCQVMTTTPFRGKHPVIEANGTVAFDGTLQLALDLGFSQEVEALLKTKRYFRPFATICRRKDDYLILPGSLTLTGTLDNPSVDLTDLLTASAKAGLQNLFEDAAGRIGIRLQRYNKETK